MVPSSIEQKIKKLQQLPDCYGTVLEMGAGVGIASYILSIPGASNLINFSLSPYSKDSFNRLLGDSGHRTVSLEHVEYCLKHQTLRENSKFVIVTSFQIGDDTYPHGWIGICDTSTNNYNYFHLSFSPVTKNRDLFISDVAKTAINLLYDLFMGTNETAKSTNPIDGYFYGETPKFSLKITMSFMQSRFPFSGFAYNLQNKTWSRIEDFLRSAPDVYLYKGTFNPYHEGHQFALDIGLSRSSASALVISADSVGKDLFKADPFNFDPALRIEQLSNSVQIGWLLFMPDLKLFNETKQTLLLRAERSNTKLKSLNFIMGDDTLKRVVDMKDFDTLVEGCKLFVIKRSPSADIPAEVLSHKNVTYVEDNPYPEISSTKIREKAGIWKQISNHFK